MYCMKTGIIYATKYSTTERIARLIKDKINSGCVQLINLENGSEVDLSLFDRIVLGTPIYAGLPMKSMKDFCKKYNDALSVKPLYTFISGMETNADKRTLEMVNAYPYSLRIHASGNYFLGGSFQFEKMTFMERMIVKYVSKKNESFESVNYHAIDLLSNSMNKADRKRTKDVLFYD